MKRILCVTIIMISILYAHNYFPNQDKDLFFIETDITNINTINMYSLNFGYTFNNRWTVCSDFGISYKSIFDDVRIGYLFNKKIGFNINYLILKQKYNRSLFNISIASAYHYEEDLSYIYGNETIYSLNILKFYTEVSHVFFINSKCSLIPAIGLNYNLSRKIIQNYPLIEIPDFHGNISLNIKGTILLRRIFLYSDFNQIVAGPSINHIISFGLGIII